MRSSRRRRPCWRPTRCSDRLAGAVLDPPLQVLDRALHHLVGENLPHRPGQPHAGVEGERVGRERRAVAPILERHVAGDVLHVAVQVLPRDPMRWLVRVAEPVADRLHLGVDLEGDVAASTRTVATLALYRLHRSLPVGEALVVEQRVEALVRRARHHDLLLCALQPTSVAASSSITRPAGGGPTRWGYKMWASSSMPSTSRGPGREK